MERLSRQLPQEKELASMPPTSDSFEIYRAPAVLSGGMSDGIGEM